MNKVPNSDVEGRPIVETPGICGGSARIYGTRIPVWVVEGARRSGWSNFDLLENYPTINQADLEMVWAFVSTHREKIEQEIRENKISWPQPTAKHFEKVAQQIDRFLKRNDMNGRFERLPPV